MNRFVEVIKEELTKLKKMLKQTGTDYVATVTSVEGQTARVQIAGSDITDTPVALSISARPGDKVRVRVANGKAWITGNDTAPPTDDKNAIEMIENTNQGLIETEAKYSRIDQTIDNITLVVGEKMDADMGNRSSNISIDSGKIEFNSNTLVVNSSKFTLDENGNATFGGQLNAATGSFEGTVNFKWQTGTSDEQDISIGNNSTAPIYLSHGNLNSDGFVGALSANLLNFKDYNKYVCLLGAPLFKLSYNNNAVWTQITPYGLTQSSDERLKRDIEDIDPHIAMRIRPVQFRFRGNDELLRFGFIAQEVQEVLPDAVAEDDSGLLSLNYQELIAPLYALVQEQEKRIETLEKQLKGGDQ